MWLRLEDTVTFPLLNRTLASNDDMKKKWIEESASYALELFVKHLRWKDVFALLRGGASVTAKSVLFSSRVWRRRVEVVSTTRLQSFSLPTVPPSLKLSVLIKSW
jgi:hypothetical protein